MVQYTEINHFKAKKFLTRNQLMNIIQGKDKADKKINLRNTQLGREKKLNLNIIPFIPRLSETKLNTLY